VSPAPSSSAAPPPVPERPWGVTQADRGTPVESRSGITGLLGDANSQKAAIRDANGQDHLFDAADVRPAAPNVPRGTAPNPDTLATNPGPWGAITDAHRGLPVETKDGRTGTLSAGPLPNTPNANVAIQDAAGNSHVVPQAETRLAGSAGQDTSPPEDSATTPATPANPNTPTANPSPWGAVTDAHRGLPVETKDGRTGTLLAGPLPDTPDANVAIQDAAGNSHVVPQAETRLASTAGDDTAEGQPVSEKGRGENVHDILPRDPDEGWGEVGPNDIGKKIETRDGRKGRMRVGLTNKILFSSPTGEIDYVDKNDVRFLQEPDPWFADHVEKEVDLAHREYEPLFQQLKITPNRDANAGVSAMVNKDWNPNDPNSSPVKVNLSKENVQDHVLAKSKGNKDVADIVARSAPSEEYVHTIDILDDSQKFLRSPERANGVKWNTYRNLQKHLTMADITDSVDRLQTNPEKQREAIETLETLYRSYKMVHDTSHPDYAKTSWSEILNNPESRSTFVGEAERQLAQYAVYGDTSELGYLQPLNDIRYRAQRAFYEKALQQLNEGMFGDRFKNKVNKMTNDLKNLKDLREGQ